MVTATAERARRRTASELPWLRDFAISPPRTDAVLVNISETGVLVECGTRFRPGMRVTIAFAAGRGPMSVSGTVARSTVSAMGSQGIRYHVGVAFARPIVLPASAPQEPRRAPVLPPAPVLAPAAASSCNQW